MTQLKVYVVVIQREPPRLANPQIPPNVRLQPIQETFRFAAETYEQVWQAIADLRADPAVEVTAIALEHPQITVLACAEPLN